MADEIKEGSRVWATDQGNSGTVDEIWPGTVEDYSARLHGVKPGEVLQMATVVWDISGCAGEVPLSILVLMVPASFQCLKCFCIFATAQELQAHEEGCKITGLADGA